ncbi:MAG: hypothetical protein ACJ71W_04485 [Terriglobales bacterium]
MRTEQEIFEELGLLCTSPGYIHALAHICLNDNFVSYAESGISEDDLLQKYSWDRLIRAEITILIGLLVKRPIDCSPPALDKLHDYVDNTYRLMNELHEAISPSLRLADVEGHAPKPVLATPNNENVFREPILYSGESAYSSQFRDLAVPKYAADDNWLEQNKGFRVAEARDVVRAFMKLQDENLTSAVWQLKDLPPEEKWILAGFSVDLYELAKRAGHPVDRVSNVLAAFTLPEGELNAGFQSVHDFNIVSAKPLFKRNDSFVLFEQYSLAQALYESPFYWMLEDAAYRDAALQHRGEFAEEFVRERLAHVFGANKVFRDIKVVDAKGQNLTDIDVLALFANRAVVVQAKSKRLTLQARRGSDEHIRADFQKAVQDAYDQGLKAAGALTTASHVFVDSSGTKLPLPRIKEVFIITAVSDHYPALSFQAEEYLHAHVTEAIPAPIITDVFAIDVMTEMLESPLRLMSYIHRRSGYSGKLRVPDELTVLSYHLKANLWLDDKYDMVRLMDDISCDLNAAMTVRREGLPGQRTPDGILTKFAGTTIERVFQEIEKRPDSDAVEFAFQVLTFDEETVTKLSEGIDKCIQRYKEDGQSHDFVMSIKSNPVTGVVVHVNRDHPPLALQSLHRHCRMRKYLHRAEAWFGIWLDPYTLKVRAAVTAQYPWQRNDEVERQAKAFVKSK